MTLAEGHYIWQMISHYGFVFLTIIGVIGVIYYVYKDRQKEKE